MIVENPTNREGKHYFIIQELASFFILLLFKPSIRSNEDFSFAEKSPRPATQLKVSLTFLNGMRRYQHTWGLTAPVASGPITSQPGTIRTFKINCKDVKNKFKQLLNQYFGFYQNKFNLSKHIGIKFLLQIKMSQFIRFM